MPTPNRPQYSTKLLRQVRTDIGRTIPRSAGEGKDDAREIVEANGYSGVETGLV